MVFLRRLSRKHIAMLIGIALALGISATLYAAYVVVLLVRTPPAAGTVDPLRLNLGDFHQLGVSTNDEVHYTVHLVAKQWMYDIGQPRDRAAVITVPRHSTVTIIATSMDINHSLVIDTFAPLIILPGHIAEATYTFDTPGSYVFHCSIYCGPKHEDMIGRIIVTP